MSSSDKPRPTSGHWIGTQPALPENIPTTLPPSSSESSTTI